MGMEGRTYGRTEAKTSGKHVRVMYTPLNPFCYIKTGVCRGIPIFLIFAPKHRLWVLVRTASPRKRRRWMKIEYRQVPEIKQDEAGSNAFSVEIKDIIRESARK